MQITKKDMLRIDVADGKYTLVQDSEGRQFALRHGTPWRQLTGDGLTLALGYELEAARRQRDYLLEQFRLLQETDFTDANCASVEVASKRVGSFAANALATARKLDT